MLLEIKDLDFGKLGSVRELKLEQDLLLDDSAFSNKPLQIARAGETVKLMHLPNYGLVIHPIFGNFRD